MREIASTGRPFSFNTDQGGSSGLHNSLSVSLMDSEGYLDISTKKLHFINYLLLWAAPESKDETNQNCRFGVMNHAFIKMAYAAAKNQNVKIITNVMDCGGSNYEILNDATQATNLIESGSTSKYFLRQLAGKGLALNGWTYKINTKFCELNGIRVPKIGTGGVSKLSFKPENHFMDLIKRNPKMLIRRKNDEKKWTHGKANDILDLFETIDFAFSICKRQDRINEEDVKKLINMDKTWKKVEIREEDNEQRKL